MQISYFGLSSFKFGSKNYTSIIDPFDKSSGLTPPRGNADLVMLSEKNNPLYSYTQSISGNPFVIDGPGEYDVREHAITGIPIKQDGRIITVYLIEIEGVKILDLSHIKKLELKQDELEDLGEADILILPVGNNAVMDFETAVKAANLLEPKIIIPSHYKTEGLKTPADNLEKFLKEIGGKHENLDKLNIKKKDIADEAVKVAVLEPLR